MDVPNQIMCVVLAICLLQGVNGLQCMVGSERFHRSMYCPGSCYKDLRPGYEYYGCTRTHERYGCRTIDFVRYCYCNSNDCNGRLRQQFTLPQTTKNQGGAIQKLLQMIDKRRIDKDFINP